VLIPQPVHQVLASLAFVLWVYQLSVIIFLIDNLVFAKSLKFRSLFYALFAKCTIVDCLCLTVVSWVGRGLSDHQTIKSEETFRATCYSFCHE